MGSRVRAGSAALVLVVGAVVAGAPPSAASSRSPVASAAPAEGWGRDYNSGGFSSRLDDNATDVVTSPDGARVFTFGTSESPRHDSNYRIVAYDSSSGAQQWTKQYDAPAHGDDVPHGVVVSPDGLTVFVTGSSQGAGGTSDIFTIAYRASSGVTLWQVRSHSPAGVSAVGDAIAVTPDGAEVVVSGNSGNEHLLFAYDVDTGVRRWATRDEASYGSSVGVSPDGTKVVVTGHTGSDIQTVAYRTSDGRALWNKRFDGGHEDYPVDLVVSPDGSRVFVAGISEGPPSADFRTIAYRTSTGAQLWTRRADGAAHLDDSASSVDVTPDGATVIVTGTSRGTSRSEALTVAYDTATGTKRWSKRFANASQPVFVADGAANPVRKEFYVTGELGGSLEPPMRSKLVTIAYSTTTGTRLWTVIYDPGEFVSRGGLAVHPGGTDLFVVGTEFPLDFGGSIPDDPDNAFVTLDYRLR
jgi:outer membrane protein assembly factor BamB